MSRIAPLEPPYAPELEAAVRPHHARRAADHAVPRDRQPVREPGENSRAGKPVDRGPLSLREREIVIDRTRAADGLRI